MCSATPAAPKSYQPSAPVNGTFTPAKAYTQAEQDAIMAEATTGPGVQGVTMGDPYLFSRGAAQRQINDRAGQASADAQYMAGLGRQDIKSPAARQNATNAVASSSLVETAGAAGGPTSLITGGTAADALSKGKVAPTATLLGG